MQDLLDTQTHSELWNIESTFTISIQSLTLLQPFYDLVCTSKGIFDFFQVIPYSSIFIIQVPKNDLMSSEIGKNKIGINYLIFFWKIPHGKIVNL